MSVTYTMQINDFLVENNDRNGKTAAHIAEYIDKERGSCDTKVLRRALKTGVDEGTFLLGSSSARWKATPETKKLAKKAADIENSSPKVFTPQRPALGNPSTSYPSACPGHNRIALHTYRAFLLPSHAAAPIFIPRPMSCRTPGGCED